SRARPAQSHAPSPTGIPRRTSCVAWVLRPAPAPWRRGCALRVSFFRRSWRTFRRGLLWKCLGVPPGRWRHFPDVACYGSLVKRPTDLVGGAQVQAGIIRPVTVSAGVARIAATNPAKLTRQHYPDKELTGAKKGYSG